MLCGDLGQGYGCPYTCVPLLLPESEGKEISTNLIYCELWNSGRLVSSGYGARFVMLTASRIRRDYRV